MKRLIAAAVLLPAPALAAPGPFFTLANTDFVVLLGFLVFIGVLLYFRVPSTVVKMLDTRAEGIRKDLAEARELREEAQSLLASYERKQKEVDAQAERIVQHAKEDARAHAERMKRDMEETMERRLQAAKDQIAAAEEKAVRDVRNRAVDVAVAAARRVLTDQMDAERGGKAIDRSIDTVGQRLN